MTKLINILIRHKDGRELLLLRCLASVRAQTFVNYKIIVSNELTNIHPYKGCENIIVASQHYNLHCNDLKAQVKEGWFFYMDDDDALASPSVLQDISNIIVNNYPFKGAYIGRYTRNGRIKPPMDHIRKGIIQKGFIGGGVAVVHHSYKDSANWQGVIAGDYLWLKEMQDNGVPMKFIDLVIQKTFNNGLHGK